MPTQVIQLTEAQGTRMIHAPEGANLWAVLRENGVYIAAVCGGKGTCGRCAVRIIRQAPPPTPAETTFFSEAQLSQGYRLACTATVADGMAVVVAQANEQDERSRFTILETYIPQEPLVCDRTTDPQRYGIAVDIGTTTIAFELVSLCDGKRRATHSVVNRQRALGADVITRIQQAGNGKQEELHTYVVEDIRDGIACLCRAAGIPYEAVTSMAVTGNTTMLHILLGLPCQSLGYYPFTPVSVDMARHTFGALLGEGLLHVPVTVLPGVSAFVGADITAGILFCGGIRREKPCLLIDLGTNGEMALFSKDRIIVTSTAAGPAFEAGNISCGTGSVSGAIAKVSYNPTAHVYEYETIGNRLPTGLCGTGVLDVAAQLVLHGIADETGLLDEDYFDDGVTLTEGITFTQKDLREIQLAKSAVRAGLEVLLANAECGYDAVDKVYIAGGFGHKINLDSAVAIGLIPTALRDKVVIVGNAALGGCVRVLTGAKAEQDIRTIAENAQEINLSVDPRFNSLFMEHMMFAL